MYISRKTDYGLILMGALKDTFVSGRFKSLRSIATQYRLPYAYIEKLAKTLKQSGIVESHVGKDGGYRLVKNPRNTTLQDIVDVFQGKPIMRCMALTLPEKSCALVSVCPTRKGWYKAEIEIRKTLERFTLDQL